MEEKKQSAREQAFAVVFEKSFNADMSVQEIIDFATEYESIKISEKAANLSIGIEKNLEEIDSIIEAHLRGWSKARISRVALAVLRLGVYELSFTKSAPVGVIISEAINICKIYATSEDKAFVNGVLGTIARGQQ